LNPLQAAAGKCTPSPGNTQVAHSVVSRQEASFQL
jgi:hypothetical protein